MSLATEALVRAEGNLPDQIKEGKIAPHIASAEIEIERIVDYLSALVIDYAYLDNDVNFTQDGGDSYRFTYAQIATLGEGYDKDDNANYQALLVQINAALVSNGQIALTDKQKTDLKQAGFDFRKAEVLLALSYFTMVGGLRPTQEGGFVNQVQFGSGTAQILDLDKVKIISDNFKRRAYVILFPWIKDPESSDDTNPTYFQHPDFNLSACPEPEYQPDNPRERYSGGQT